MIPIQKNKIARIHILKSQLRLSDESYRDILSGFRAKSCKDLDDFQGVQLIMVLERLFHSQKANSGGNLPQFKNKYNELGDRPGMASPKQLRKIEALWADVSYKKDADGRKKALLAFIHRICGVSALEWLEPQHISKLIRAMSSMKNNTKGSEKRMVTGSLGFHNNTTF